MNSNERIKQCLSYLVTNDPFLSIIGLTVKFKEDNERCPTACTDGKDIYYNTEFVDKLSNKELIYVVCHEIMHIALGHAYRSIDINANPKIWNIAADMVVNHQLEQHRLGKPIEGRIECPSKYSAWDTESIYKDLLQQGRKSEGIGAANPLSNDLQKPESESACSDNTLEEIRQFHKGIMEQATSLSKDYTKQMGDEFGRLMEKILSPVLDWRTLLKKFVSGYIKADYSWARPNRRFCNMYLPSISGMKPELKTMNVYIDVSGSVEQETLDRFFGEIRYIHKYYGLSEIKLIAFSTELDEPQVIKERWQKPKEFYSTGGTDIEPVVNHILKDKAKLNLIFTDGYFDQYPVDMLKGNVFWVIYDNPKYIPSKGTVSHVDI